MVVLARAKGSSFRYITRDWFHDGDKWDLPSPLVMGCVHWL